MLIYAELFFACLVGVCALVVIGDKLRSVYIDWLGSTDLVRDEPTERRHVYIESLLMQ
jgi:hypothetical protein